MKLVLLLWQSMGCHEWAKDERHACSRPPYVPPSFMLPEFCTTQQSRNYHVIWASNLLWEGARFQFRSRDGSWFGIKGLVPPRNPENAGVDSNFWITVAVQGREKGSKDAHTSQLPFPSHGFPEHIVWITLLTSTSLLGADAYNVSLGKSYWRKTCVC